jgi:hypothetical protein
MNYKKRLSISAIVLSVSSFATQANLLVSADFGPDIQSPNTISGVESAAAASPLFENANVWNNLTVNDVDAGSGPFSPTVNPVFSGLNDSEGNATSVQLSITGELRAFDNVDFFGSPATDKLADDYFFFNSQNNPTTSIDWMLSGLMANMEYVFYAYGALGTNRLFDMTVDTDGDGDFSDEIAKQIGSTSAPTNGMFTVRSNAFGEIIGKGEGIGAAVGFDNEATWGGFQIAKVPVPGTLLLMFLPLLAIFRSRKA